MPFSEMLRMAEGKASTVAADLSPGDACRPGNDLMELVLENGQITMQGRPSRSSKAPKSDNFQSVFPKSQDGKGSINSKVSKFGMQESIMNDFELLVPSGEMGLDQDHDMVPWLNYSIGEPLRNNYCSDLSHELFGVTANDLSSRNNLGSMEKRSGFNHTAGSSHVSSAHNTLTLQQGSVLNASSSAVEFNRAKSSEVSPLMQFQRAVPGSGISGIPCNKLSNAQNFIYRLSVCSPASASGSNGVKPQKHDAGQPSCSSGFLNFSHFSRPALLARAALLRTDTTAGPVLNGTERSGKEGTVCATSSSNPPESSVVSLTNGSSGKEMLSYTPQIMPPANGVPETMPSKPAEGPISANQFEAIQHESAAENDKLPNQPHGGTVGKAMTDGAKTAESVFVASSVCSGCSMQRASNDPMHYLKRKCSDTSDSEGPSEEVEEESVGVRKAFPASIGTKRRRDADVHNLSERRRRDRINEKMRVLQELIPNCNKADKSSMLDEAIEYLKTLQLQVQILSMGAGLYMLPMMLPTRMQHMPGPHMSHFSPMGVGMGFGMNTLDMNGAMMQVPPIQGPPYPVPVNPISISSSFLGMTESSLQALGQPGQGLPLSMPPTPLLQLVGSPSLKLPMGVNGFGVVAPSGASHSVPSISSKDGVQDIGSQAMSNSNLCSAINQATNVGIQRPAALQAQAANAGEAPHPAGGNNIQPS